MNTTHLLGDFEEPKSTVQSLLTAALPEENSSILAVPPASRAWKWSQERFTNSNSNTEFIVEPLLIPVIKVQVILAKNVLCPASVSQTENNMLYRRNSSPETLSKLFRRFFRCLLQQQSAWLFIPPQPTSPGHPGFAAVPGWTRHMSACSSSE